MADSTDNALDASENTPKGSTPDNSDKTKTEESKPDPKAPLTRKEQIWAGFLLIFFICLSLTVIIAFWPDRVDPAKTGTAYSAKLFHVTLLTKSDSIPAKSGNKPIDSTKQSSDTLTTEQKAAIKKQVDELVAEAKKKLMDDTSKKTHCKRDGMHHDEHHRGHWCTIQLNGLLLILVAAAGFLGNMVHISSSFTAFVGAGRFNRTWILWYITKPFTASGLALFLFFALNGSNIGTLTMANLYTIMTTAALAGLFTDIATQKLKEIFTAVFKPNDDRPDKLNKPVMTVDMTSVHPDKIDVKNLNVITIPGTNLDINNLVIKINGVNVIAPMITATLIKFNYTVATADQTKTIFELEVTDKTGKSLGKKELGV